MFLKKDGQWYTHNMCLCETETEGQHSIRVKAIHQQDGTRVECDEVHFVSKATQPEGAEAYFSQEITPEFLAHAKAYRAGWESRAAQ